MSDWYCTRSNTSAAPSLCIAIQISLYSFSSVSITYRIPYKARNGLHVALIFERAVCRFTAGRTSSQIDVCAPVKIVFNLIRHRVAIKVYDYFLCYVTRPVRDNWVDSPFVTHDRINTLFDNTAVSLRVIRADGPACGLIVFICFLQSWAPFWSSWRSSWRWWG